MVWQGSCPGGVSQCLRFDVGLYKGRDIHHCTGVDKKSKGVVRTRWGVERRKSGRERARGRDVIEVEREREREGCDRG